MTWLLQNVPPDGGSCGFGPLHITPNVIGSIDSASPIVAQLPSDGCGSCIQLTCTNQVNVYVS